MKKVYITFLALVLAIAMIVPAGVVNAGSGKIEVSGSVDFYFDPLNFVVEKMVGEPPVIMGTIGFDVDYNGDIDGNAHEILSFVMNTSTGELPNYKSSAHGTQVFNGVVNGYEGTFTAHVRHQTRLDGSCKVEQTIISGTGELTNLHGTLIFTIYRLADGSYAGTYSGKLHFAP